VAKPRTTKAKHTRTTRKQLAAKVAKQAASIGTAEDRLTEAVRAGVVHALREPGSVVIQLFDTAAEQTQEAMAAARSVGGDLLTSARSVTRGILLGVSDAGGDIVASAGHVVRAAISSAAGAGSEAAAVGWSALQGAVDAAQTVGADVAATARGAVEAVADTVLSAGESATGLVDRLVKTATTRPQYAPAKPAARKTRKRPVMKRKVARLGAMTGAKGTAKTARNRGSTASRKKRK
jgi:hypothetical protein